MDDTFSMMLSANVGEMDSSSTISALKAITTDPDMLTEESSNKALKILDMSSGGDFLNNFGSFSLFVNDSDVYSDFSLS